MLVKIESFIECGENVCNYGMGETRICRHLSKGEFRSFWCNIFNINIMEISRGTYQRCNECMKCSVVNQENKTENIMDNNFVSEILQQN